MRRIKLDIAYDGTGYCGWQLQPGKQTVEEIINKTLSQLFQEEIAVIGASRTDSGVHAIGNVAVFDTNSRMAAEKICFAINQRLPDDIRVQKSMEVSSDFHPRRIRNRKTYEYRILNRKIAMPTERLYSDYQYCDLDVTAMQKAADYLVGEHDFKSFCSIKTRALETVRTIYRLEITKSEDIITISVTGNGFLYNMVRIIVGTLIKVGKGAFPPEKIPEILKGHSRALAGPTAHANGLTLIQIEYENTSNQTTYEDED